MLLGEYIKWEMSKVIESVCKGVIRMIDYEI